MPHGHSGFTYLVRGNDGDMERSLALRLPPPGARPLGPADVVRRVGWQALGARISSRAVATAGEPGSTAVRSRPAFAKGDRVDGAGAGA